MEQINAYVFFLLGHRLRDCYAHARLPVALWIDSARVSKTLLDGLLAGDARFALDVSRSAAETLSAALGAIIASYESHPVVSSDPPPDVKLNETELNYFNSMMWGFDSAIALELGRAPLFFVTPKGAYDTRTLISNAASMYEGYINRLPKEAIDDTNAAGRCFAFGLDTAAGFHLARATEAVIKQYMESYGCAPVKESQRNWGIYTKALREKNADRRIINHIDQLRILHRNPITHPELTLNRPSALALQAMCQSLIQAMVADMETKLAIPDPSIVAMLPPPEPEPTLEN